MIVNGKEMTFEENSNVIDLLNKLNLDEEKVVVEINMEIISKEVYSERILNDDDKIEIVGFIGGG
ncbi:sulfur carrier protein ThiS [Sporosalibacterium faouarense]|uniref:sulfur carrier protein ThiS n=1 Tax=Sporosalibacterium faouarense TaxID=516123 RepID=UPI00192B71B8